jgi:hypothetical protein
LPTLIKTCSRPGFGPAKKFSHVIEPKFPALPSVGAWHSTPGLETGFPVQVSGSRKNTFGIVVYLQVYLQIIARRIKNVPVSNNTAVTDTHGRGGSPRILRPR